MADQPVIETPNNMTREEAVAYQAAWRERKKAAWLETDRAAIQKHAADYDRLTQTVLDRRPIDHGSRASWGHTRQALRSTIANIHTITLRQLGRRHAFHAAAVPDTPAPGEETWPEVEILRASHRKAHHDRAQGLASIAEILAALK